MADALIFAAVAVTLYFLADWLLRRLEESLDRRLEHRTLVFFAILLILALIAFTAIRRITGP